MRWALQPNGGGQSQRRRHDLHLRLFLVPLRRQLCGGSATGPIPDGSPSLSRSTQPIRRWPMSSPIGRKRCVGVHIILMKEAKRESNLRRNAPSSWVTPRRAERLLPQCTSLQMARLFRHGDPSGMEVIGDKLPSTPMEYLGESDPKAIADDNQSYAQCSARSRSSHYPASSAGALARLLPRRTRRKWARFISCEN